MCNIRPGIKIELVNRTIISIYDLSESNSFSFYAFVECKHKYINIKTMQDALTTSTEVGALEAAPEK
jgi:hypothetical protein